MPDNDAPDAVDTPTQDVVAETAPDPDLSAELTAEAVAEHGSFEEYPTAPEQVKAERPKDAPHLPPLHALPRQKRARFWAGAVKVDLESLQNLQDEAGEDGTPRKLSMTEEFERIRALEDVNANIELALDPVIPAIPAIEAAWSRWKASHNDLQDPALIKLYSWYLTTMSPGEAPPSPTS